MSFKKINIIVFSLFTVLLFGRFSCDEKSESKLTVINVTVSDELTDELVSNAIIGIYSWGGCLRDTILTNIEGKATYTFLTDGYDRYYIQTVPMETNESSNESIWEGIENEISLKTRFLSPAFEVTVATQYDSLFLKSKDGFIENIYYYEQGYCEEQFSFDRNNDQIDLYDNIENLTFPVEGVIGKLNYIFVKKYLLGSLKIDTISIIPEFDNHPVLIE